MNKNKGTGTTRRRRITTRPQMTHDGMGTDINRHGQAWNGH